MKKYFYIIICLSFAIFFNGCSTSNNSKANEDTVTKSEKVEPASYAKSPSEDNATLKDYYEIIGSCSTLSEKELKNLTQWRSDIRILANKYKDSLIINGLSNLKEVSLTFDDGADNKFTPAIIDVLNKKEVKGNFFFIGDNIDANPNVVKKAFNDGHLVLNHSLSHKDLSTLKEDDFKKEILANEEKIKKITGKAPALLRPPYGSIKENQIHITDSLGIKNILWSTDTLDWSQRDKNNIYKNVIDNVRPGEIILMHSNANRQATLDALPLIIDSLKEKGYNIVTLDKLLNVNAYK